MAIEPDPITATYLARNIAANDVQSLCDIAQTAVGKEEGTISFTVGKDTVNQVQNDVKEPSQVVPLTRLDSLVADTMPALMKMDVEGYELEALEGSEKILSSSQLMAIIIENTDPKVVAILADHGFSRYSYDPVSRCVAQGITGLKSNNGIFVRDAAALTERLQGSSRRVYRGQIV